MRVEKKVNNFENLGTIFSVFVFLIALGVFLFWNTSNAKSEFGQFFDNNIQTEIIQKPNIKPIDVKIEKENDKVQVSYEITNVNNTVMQTPDFYNGLYLSQDEVFDFNDTLLKEKFMVGLLASEIKNDSIEAVMPPDLIVGDEFYLIFYTDNLNHVREDVGGDNYYVIKVEV